MIKLLLICSIILAGCGQDKSDEIQWSGKTSERSANFIISYDKTKYSNQIERVESWWVDVQECAGVSIDISDRPLMIDYIDAAEIRPGVVGFITPWNRSSHIVLIDLNDYYGDGWITRHEMLHYLLHIIGASESENLDDHSHPFFDSCAGVIQARLK